MAYAIKSVVILRYQRADRVVHHALVQVIEPVVRFFLVSKRTRPQLVLSHCRH